MMDKEIVKIVKDWMFNQMSSRAEQQTTCIEDINEQVSELAEALEEFMNREIIIELEAMRHKQDLVQNYSLDKYFSERVKELKKGAKPMTAKRMVELIKERNDEDNI